MTGSRAAADAAIYMASHGWMSEDNVEPFLRTALVGRVRRLYDQVYGRGAAHYGRGHNARRRR